MTAVLFHSVLPASRLRPSVLAIASVCAGWAALPAQAQTATALESVVVTGGTREQKLAEAPYAINAVGAEALRSAGPMVNLSEALQSVPGLVVANRSNYAQDLQISSRGFGARAGFGVRGLRLYTDGIPATMPDGQGQVAHFDLASADRVEVLRGPFSALYGNSSGGVIALYSAPITRRSVEASYDHGSFGLRQERLAFATPLDGGFSVAANVSNLDIDGFRPRSDAERQLGNVRLGWKGEADKVSVALSHQRQRANDPLGLTRELFDANPDQTATQATDFNTRKTIDQTQLGASWQHRVAGDGALRSTQLAAYTGQRAVVQFLATLPTAQNIATAPTSGGGVIDFDRRYEGLDGRLTWSLGDADLVTGVNLERQRDSRLGYENFTGTVANPTARGVVGNLRRDETNQATTREVYSQLEWPFADRWLLTAGLRSGSVTLSNADRYIATGNPDDSGSLRYSYTTPVLGFRHQVDPHLTFHGSVSRGYESPTLGEVAYKAASAGSGFNTGLKAQTSQQIELGSKWRQGGFALDFTLFQISTGNEIGVLTNQTGRSAFQNVGRTERSGAELGASWKINPSWRTQVALTALQALYRDNFQTCTGIPCNPATRQNTATVPAGNRIAGTQNHSAYAEVAWTPFWSNAAEAGLEWRAAGPTVANDLNTAVAARYTVMALRYRQDFALDEQSKIELLARIDNLSDKRYAGSVIVNEANQRYYEPAPGRNKLVSLRYKRNF